jgi:hypothetical protein
MKKFAALGSVTLMATGAAVTASPANAVALADCGTHGNATVELINNSICSVTFSSAGAYTFTAPAGVLQLEALLIGAGAGGFSMPFGYGGGAGEVLFVDELDPAVTHSGEVGAGSEPGVSDSLLGEPSTLGLISAEGGEIVFGENGAASGSGNAGYSLGVNEGLWTWGGGAKTAASNANGGTEGSGYLPSDPTLTLGSALFPVVSGERELGRGGKPTTSLPTQFIGWGGSTASPSSSQNGADGGVIFRFIAPQAEPTPPGPVTPELAKTGAAPLGFMNSLLSAALIGLGALGLRYSLRRKTR